MKIVSFPLPFFCANGTEQRDRDKFSCLYSIWMFKVGFYLMYVCVWILLCLLKCNYGMWKLWFSKFEIVIVGFWNCLCDWTECCFIGPKTFGCYEADSSELIQEQIMLRLYQLNAND